MEQSDTKSTTQTKKRRFSWTVPLVVILALLAGFLGSWIEDATDSNLGSPLNVLNESSNDGNATVTASEKSIASVAKEVSPSVVSVLTSSKQLSYFNRTVQQEGAGTGMIVSKNGYIMTNKHVVSDADSVTVVLSSGKIYKNVQVIGTDPLNDVAFLKIKDVTNLPAIQLGNSKTVRIGQTVVAIGNALGQYQNTVTSGIISGTGRPVVASSDGTSETAESLTDLLQTDAAINSGNSGGPLLNLQGQVIGINTAIAQDAQSIGFAIPISATKGMLQHLTETGKLERAYLGVQYVSITPDVRTKYKLDVAKGDYITADKGEAVLKGGPADKAGITDGDIITEVNGSKVGEVASISTLVSEYQPGDTIDLKIRRGDETLTLKATLETYKSN